MVFFWILAGLTWLGGVVSMLTDLLNLSVSYQFDISFSRVSSRGFRFWLFLLLFDGMQICRSSEKAESSSLQFGTFSVAQIPSQNTSRKTLITGRQTGKHCII